MEGRGFHVRLSTGEKPKICIKTTYDRTYIGRISYTVPIVMCTCTYLVTVPLADEDEDLT